MFGGCSDVGSLPVGDTLFLDRPSCKIGEISMKKWHATCYSQCQIFWVQVTQQKIEDSPTKSMDRWMRVDDHFDVNRISIKGISRPSGQVQAMRLVRCTDQHTAIPSKVYRRCLISPLLNFSRWVKMSLQHGSKWKVS